MASNFLYKRILIISIVISVLGLLIVSKLFILQIVKKNKYENKAEGQYVIDPGTSFSRGSIFYTTKNGGRISAATVLSGYKIALDNTKINNPEDIYQKLEPFIKISKETFLERAQKQHDTYEEIARFVSKEDKETIEKLNIPGVRFFLDTWRYYPGKTLGSQVTGFVGYKGDTYTGRYGIEQYYNTVLGGSEDAPSLNFFAEVFTNLREVISHSNTKQGDVITTIDPYAQTLLEDSLKGVVKEWSSDQVGGIIIDPYTGEILAMGNYPTFDPNEYGTVTDQSYFKNPLVEGVYEVGSIMKTVTMASGLDSGAITPETTFNDTGIVVLNKKEIRNAQNKHYGVVPMQQVLSKSLNTGATFIMQRMGKEKFREYMLKFGFGEKTGIDLPGEADNLVNNLYSPRDVEYATASFGQGIAVTPISAVRAFSAIANGGYLVTPHVVKEIDYQDGEVDKKDYEKNKKQIITKKTSDQVKQMMVTVVDKELLGGTVKLTHYTAGAKTGTAQIANAQTGKYEEGKFMHTMYAFFPGYDPKYLIFMYNLNPKNIDFASKTLSRPIFELGEGLLSYYNVSPDR